MKFTVENGNNSISIGLSTIGSYFRFNYPLSVVWDDCGGSVGKYFCLLPYNETYRNELRNKLTNSLDKDFSGNTGELFSLIEPLFQLFRNGNYTLQFFANGTFFEYQTSINDPSVASFGAMEVVFTEVTDINNAVAVEKNHREFLSKNKTSKEFYPSDILYYTTYNIYGDDHLLFATQPLNAINQERVKYFEECIKKGERPFAILVRAFYAEAGDDSAYFILDGHHKLLAYSKTGVQPPVALITYLPSKKDIEFNIEKLAGLLYPWQTKHILQNWYDKDEYIEGLLKDPDNVLHQFIKNGPVKEYHENGKLKHEAFYINDRVDGPSKDWYENGKLKYDHYYNKGIRIGTWKDYYESGRVQFIQPFNEYGQYNGHTVSYYENGRKRWEQFTKNGMSVDGYSHKSWYENGDKEAELKYRDGQMIERKNWNGLWELVNHEVYDPETKQLEKKFITNPGRRKKQSYEKIRFVDSQLWLYLRIILVTLFLLSMLVRACSYK